MTSRPSSQPTSPSNSVPHQRISRISRPGPLYRDSTESYFVKSKSAGSSAAPINTAIDYFDPSANSASSTSTNYTPSILPSNAPQELVAATIFLENARYIEAIYDADRKRQYQALVRRYMNQLLYGCDREGVCAVPTCWTARKRLAGSNAPGGVGKGRRPTVLSARIMACHLASRENPYEGLCPGRQVGASLAVDSRRTKKDSGKGKLKPSPSFSLTEPWRTDVGQGKENGEGGGIARVAEKSENADGEKNENANLDTAQTSKEAKSQKSAVDRGARDTKSFTQMLFDTKPLRMLEFFAIPPPPISIFRLGMGKDRLRESAINGRAEDSRALKLDMSIVKCESSNESKLEMPQDSIDVDENKEPLDIDDSDTHMLPPSTPLREPTPPPPVAHKRRETLHEAVTPTPHSNYRRAGSSNDPPQTPIAPPPVHQHHRQHRRERPQYELQTPTQYHQSQFTELFHGVPPPQQTPSRSSGAISSKNLDYIGSLTPTDPSPQEASDYPISFENTSTFPPPQSLAFLNISMILSLVKVCIDSDLTPQKHQEAEAFAKQSVFYCLSCPEAIMKSFVVSSSPKKDEATSASAANLANPNDGLDVDPLTTDKAFRILDRKWEITVMKSLWRGLGELYKYKSTSTNRQGTPGPNGKGKSATATSSEPRQHMLDDYTAARMIVLAMHALAAMLPREGSYLPRPYAREDEWQAMRSLRGRGLVTVDLADCFENELAERLMKRIVRALDYRISQAQQRITPGEENPVVKFVKDHLVKCTNAELGHLRSDSGSVGSLMAKFRMMDRRLRVGRNWTLAGCMVEWARAVVMKNWEGTEEVKKGTFAAGGLGLMRLIYECHKDLCLEEEIFHTPFFADRFDPKETPVEWYKSQVTTSSREEDPNTPLHLLSFPFLFTPATLVTYFRSINLYLMTTAYESALNALSLLRHVSLNEYFPHTKALRDKFVEDKLKIACTTYLLLGIRREHIMEDAFNGVYKREIRELVKPLKVKFLDSGEEGVDQGGPQYEFFNVLMKEVMQPEYGMFADTDAVNHVNWFAIEPFEPLHKFELLGVLIGIAVYNGITLPVNFPLVFYKLMLHGVDGEAGILRIEDIEDGWPELARGLQELLNWDEGDVEDVFVRTYEFTYEKVGGGIVNVDMLRAKAERWKGPVGGGKQHTRKVEKKGKGKEKQKEDNNGEEVEIDISSTTNQPPLHSDDDIPAFSSSAQDEDIPFVNNSNRAQYVIDYIHFLTVLSVRAQLSALRKGLLTILPPVSLKLLNPPHFKSLVEGIQTIDITLLESISKYDDGYHPTHPVVQEFWAEVKKFTNDEKKALLEFVTASDRVPVNGLASLTFVIQRNGGDSELLPTSMTCFGRLLLPEYKVGRGKVSEKLKRALENSKGFGII